MTETKIDSILKLACMKKLENARNSVIAVEKEISLMDSVSGSFNDAAKKDLIGEYKAALFTLHDSILIAKTFISVKKNQKGLKIDAINSAVKKLNSELEAVIEKRKIDNSFKAVVNSTAGCQNCRNS